MKAEPFVVVPSTYAKALNVLGINVTVLASNDQTQGYEITLQGGDDGVGPPPHSHTWDESFYVLSGNVEISVEGQAHACEAGTLVHLPAGTVHSYRFGPGGGKMFEITGAGGNATRTFANLNREVPPGPPDVPMLTTLLQSTGVTLALA